MSFIKIGRKKIFFLKIFGKKIFCSKLIDKIRLYRANQFGFILTNSNTLFFTRWVCRKVIHRVIWRNKIKQKRWWCERGGRGRENDINMIIFSTHSIALSTKIKTKANINCNTKNKCSIINGIQVNKQDYLKWKIGDIFFLFALMNGVWLDY